MAKQKQNRYYTRTIDLIFLLILLCTLAVSFYIAITFGILPKRWVLIAGTICLIVFLILFILTIKKLPKWAVICKRVFILLLCLVVGSSGYFLNLSRTTIKKISKAEEEKVTEISIIVPKDSAITSVEELNGKTVGFQNGVDIENGNFAKEELQKDATSIITLDKDDYTSLIDNLSLGAIDAIAISDTFYSMSKSNIKGFDERVKVLKTYTRKLPAEKKAEKDISKETFTMYLSGLDNMGSPDQLTRSDTNLLLIVNPLANHIDMVSIPRDGFMPNMAAATNGANDKLTHTGMYGIDASVQTISNFYNIPIDFYARVSFNSLIQIVDSVGGINVDVEIDFCEQDENRSFAQDNLICLKKGEQELNGKQALAYSRHRKTEGYDNPGRERAQQRIIKALISKMLTPNAITYIDKLLTIAPDYVITDLPTSQITNFVSSELDSIKPWTISSISNDNGVFDDQYPASLNPIDGYSDVYLFTQKEVHAVIDAYNGASNQLKMNTFQFDLNDLYKDTPSINQDPNIIWSTMARRPH